MGIEPGSRWRPTPRSRRSGSSRAWRRSSASTRASRSASMRRPVRRSRGRRRRLRDPPDPASVRAARRAAPAERGGDAGAVAAAAANAPAFDCASRRTCSSCRCWKWTTRSPPRVAGAWTRWFEFVGSPRGAACTAPAVHVHRPVGAGGRARPGRRAGALALPRRPDGERRPGHAVPEAADADRLWVLADRARSDAREPHVAAFRNWLTREFERGPRRQT